MRLRIERFRFSLIKRNTKQKNFLFLLKEKIAREKIKKCRENFSVLLAEAKRRRAETLGRIQSAKSSGFCSKKVRISSNRHHYKESLEPRTPGMEKPVNTGFFHGRISCRRRQVSTPRKKPRTGWTSGTRGISEAPRSSVNRHRSSWESTTETFW